MSVVFFLVSCKGYDKIYYRVGKSKIGYALDVPKGYDFEGLAGDHEFEKRYWYPDSAVIFITTFDNTLNYEEIRNQGTYYAKFSTLHAGDTITVSGETKFGLFWKEKILEFVTIGYANVPAYRKAEFEKSIRSIKNHKYRLSPSR